MTRIFATIAHSLSGMVLVAGLLIAAPCASAQHKTVNFTVPFAFSVNQQVLPAGSYRVDMSAPAYVTFLDRKSAKVVGTFPVRRELGWTVETQDRLTFFRTASGITLTQVRNAGSRSYGNLASPQMVERELASARSGSKPTQIEVAAK